MAAQTPLVTLTAADQQELVDLSHRYAAAVDDRRFSDAGDLFCPDGVLVTPGGRTTPPARNEGRAAVQTALSRVQAIPVTFHAVVGVVVEAGAGADDEASGRVACVAHHVTTGDGVDSDEVWHVVYHDRYRRTASGWRFASRELQLRFRASEQVRLSR
jgi:SnoaL-like domain